MSRAADPGRAVVGVNWGSGRLQAFRIAADGTALDAFETADGVSALDRAGMARAMDFLAARWPDRRALYACGMIGGDIGWTDAGYAPAPASARDLRTACVPARIGAVDLLIAPGVACRRAVDGAPDVMRGEEVAILGLLAAEPGLTGLVVLPGAHAKWAQVAGGRIAGFATAMAGEMHARLTSAGLLASVAQGEAWDGPAFRLGVARGSDGLLGLSTLLFGARARVVRGELPRDEAPSYVRGLLIGSEIADMRTLHPDQGEEPVRLIGEGALCDLYAAALDTLGIRTRRADPRAASLRGFLALHAAGRGRHETTSDGSPGTYGAETQTSGRAPEGVEA